VCKGLSYTAALSAFRGGPTFPAMFLGAVGGIALSHLPGLPLVPALAMGLGAMTAAILRLPMTAVLVTSLFLGSDGFPVIPLTIVAAVVAYVTENRLTPIAEPGTAGDPGPERAAEVPPPRAGETPDAASSRPAPRADRLP
jgi:H+/Cl- antiporter ClcA